MTQTSIDDILPYTQATAMAGQTIFGTTWTANYPSDVVVYYTPSGVPPDDQTQILAYPADYSVVFIGSQQDVQVTLVTPANAGDIVTITRQTPADRENLYSNTNFTPSMLNQDFGILTLVDQQAQLVNQLIAPRYNYSADITDVVDNILPILPANYVWMKNSANTGIIAVPIPSGSVPGGGSINPGVTNELAWYPADGTTLSGLPTADSGVLITSNAGVPSVSSTLPSALTIPNIVGANTISDLNTIYDANGNIALSVNYQVDAVNYLQTTNNSTGNPLSISAIGSDTNISFVLNAKGTGSIQFNTAAGILIKGFSNGAAIASGYVGEVISTTVPVASGINMPNAIATDIISISLPAGNWLLFGNIFFTFSGDGVGGSAWINGTSGTIPDASRVANGPGTLVLGLVAPQAYRSINTTTSYYLSGIASFTSGACTGCGMLTAIRVS